MPDREMKRAAFIVFTIFILLDPGSLVQAQNGDSCDSNINFNHIVNFDTTALSCQTVWKKENFNLRYREAEPGLWSFLLSAKDPNSWVAIGFSANGLMPGTSAMVGWVHQNGTSVIKQYFLQDRDTDLVLPDQGNLTVVDNSTSVFKLSNNIYMAFQLTTEQPHTELIYAIGPYNLPSASTGFKLTKHREETSTSIDYQTGQSQTQSSPYTGVQRTHGAMNMIGWGILMPIGAIVARYFKQWDPIWFYAHIGIQIFSYLFGLVGFILGFVVEDFTHAHVTNHKNLGITILSLASLQVMALFLRPQKGSKLRKYWNWYHHNAGRILVVLAISNIFYGIRLAMEGASWYGTYAVIVTLLFIVAIVLEIRLRRQR